MSFIYEDDKLIYELIKSAVEFKTKFNKSGQLAADPAVNVEYKNYLNLSSKLADELWQQYSPKEKDPSEISASQDAGMTISDMTTLGNFFDFIANNQVTVGGDRVVYFANDAPPNLDKKKWLPVDAEQSKLLMESVDQSGNRKPTEGSYYVNKDLLSTYIVSLSAMIGKEEAEAQKMMKALLGGIVEKINTIFKTNLTTNYVPPTAKTTPKVDVAGGGEEPHATPTPVGGAAGEQSQLEIIKNLADALPLDVDTIDFARITWWINEYKKIMNASKNEGRQSADLAAISGITTHMAQATALTIDSKQNFNLSGTDSSTVESWIKPPAPEKYLSFLYHLRSVLESTANLLNNFYAAYVRKVSPQDRVILNPDQKAAVEGQILGGSSIYKDNWDNIRAFESRPPQIVKAK